MNATSAELDYPGRSEMERHRKPAADLDPAAKLALMWSGWGSPVGLSIVLVSVGFFLVCLHWAGILH